MFEDLAANHGRLADELPPSILVSRYPYYHRIECVPAQIAIDVLKRFTKLNFYGINFGISQQIQDIPRFLDFLKHLDTAVGPKFLCTQPQELFDQLPGHCLAQRLTIYGPPSDLQFLLRLSNLVYLEIHCGSDFEIIRRIPSGFEELEAVSWFVFKYSSKKLSIYTDRQKRIWVCSNSWGESSMTSFPDRIAAVQFIEKMWEK